eukprot:EG_transcript_667
MSPISEVLDATQLANLKVERQHVLFFMLNTAVPHAVIQETLNLWQLHRGGFNAAVVHTPSNMLVVFSNETGVEAVPECFQVALAFWGNTCPLLQTPSPESGASIWVSGTWASIQELNSVTRALVAFQEPGIVRIEVDEGWSQLRIRLRSTEDAARIRDLAMKTLKNLGRRCAVKCNKIVLYQCAIPLGPFESIVDLSKTFQSPSSLIPIITAADAAIAAHRMNIAGDDLAYDTVMHLLAQVNCDAILRHNYRYSFDIDGMKCVECVQLILEELFLDRPGRVGYTHIALSPTRNVLAVHVPAEQRHAVEQHVQDSLLAIGIAATLIGQGPDLDPVDDPQAVALYNTLTRPRRLAHGGSVSTTMGVRLRPTSVRCASCAMLLRSTIQRLLPGVLQVAVDCNSGTMVLSLSGEVTERDILRLLQEMGYQPASFYVPPSTACGQQQAIVPPAPISPSASHYFGGNLTPMANGQLNPYGLGPRQPSSPPATPTSNMSHSYAPSDISSMGRAYLDSPAAAKKHVPVMPWKTAPDTLIPDRWPQHASEDGSTVLVFNHDTAGPISITVPMRLRHRYTVWYDNVRTRVQLQQSGEADYTLTEVAGFDTMPEFWQIWEHLNIEALEEGSILIVFRSDIPPDHNHAANRCGGRWFVRGVATEPRTKLWTKLTLAMLSDTLTANSDHEVCGVVLSVKPSGDRIEIWVDGGYHHHTDEPQAHDKESGQYLPNILTSLLGDELGHRRFHFWTHAGFERHRKSHRGSVRRAKRHSKLGEGPCDDAPALSFYGSGPN